MDREILLLLHGALGASTQFSPLIPLLQEPFEVHTLDLEGHGTSPIKDRPLRLNHFAENVIEYLDSHGVDKANIFGHSMGGHTGLYLARFFPGRVKGIFTFGTKFTWTPEIAEKENAFLVPEKMQEKVPRFVKTLQERHTASGWEHLLEKVREMHVDMGVHNPLPDEEMRQIGQKVRIGLGDRDSMVNLDESVWAYRLLQAGEFQVFPGTPHPLEKVSVNRLAVAITDFFQ